MEWELYAISLTQGQGYLHYALTDKTTWEILTPITSFAWPYLYLPHGETHI
jgi:hypothetical protein